MSPTTSRPNTLATLLSEYVRGFLQNAPDQSLLHRVLALLPQTTDPAEFHAIGERVWNEYLCGGVDVELMNQVLRRWLEVEPDSKLAKGTLGSWLLCHGPDWDEEGRRLLVEANA